jgi:uncharacterized protein (DUF697 family)
MKLDATTVGKALDLAYDKAVDGVPGVPGMESAEGLAKDYLNDPGSLEDKVNALIRYQVLKATTSGFVTGLGGVLTLPVAIPANLASVMYLQLQMVAAIARMGGHDVRSDRVRTVCYACLCGNAATDILKGAGITIGKKLTERTIKQLSFEVIKKINQKVGFRMVTKFGQTGAINLGKAIPLVGGVIGGTFDGTTTYTIGRVARSVFVTGDESSNEHPEEANAIESLSEMLFGEENQGSVSGRDKIFWGEDNSELTTRSDEPRGLSQDRGRWTE